MQMWAGGAGGGGGGAVMGVGVGPAAAGGQRGRRVGGRAVLELRR